MSETPDNLSFDLPFKLPPRAYLKRLAVILICASVGALIAFLLLWRMFFVWVPPEQHLVVVTNYGSPLKSGQVLAEPGQMGIQREVKGEGWHFVWPILYSTEVKPNTIIKPGKVGIVTARGGDEPTDGRVLALEGERGIQKHVLPPGSYRLNRYGFDVKEVDATEIPPGFVGVVRRKLGADGKGGRFATNDTEKGFLRQILQPGIYYFNTEEFEVLKAEVGIFQTTFHYFEDANRDTSINFTAKGGLDIKMDCTVEWEVRPEDMPILVAEYGSRRQVEENVIKVQARAISRDKGIDYSAQDFLEGSKREKFQGDFTKELTQVCKEKKVTIGSAFIRNIVIPETYLKPIRDKQIAHETQITNKAKEETAQIEAQVEIEKQTVQQRVAEVEAETARLVAAVDRDVQNLTSKTQTEIDKMKAEYEAKMAALDAERTQLLGQTEAEVTRMKETAKSSIYPLKMEVFQGDSNAYLRYSMAEALNPNLRLRLFHSGPGTFWTNMDGKGMNLLVPAPGATPPEKAKAVTAEK
jgi:hypothetical protein